MLDGRGHLAKGGHIGGGLSVCGFKLTLAPDALHKAHTSGGDPYAMRIPDPLADGPLLWDKSNTTLSSICGWFLPGADFPDGRAQMAALGRNSTFSEKDLLAL